MSHFVQQRLTNLPTYLCVASADSLDVSLVKKNPVGRTGEKHTFLRAGDAVKQPQQQSSVQFLRRPVVHDNCHVGELFTKLPRQAVQTFGNECLKLASLHLIWIVTLSAPHSGSVAAQRTARRPARQSAITDMFHREDKNWLAAVFEVCGPPAPAGLGALRSVWARQIGCGNEKGCLSARKPLGEKVVRIPNGPLWATGCVISHERRKPRKFGAALVMDWLGGIVFWRMVDCCQPLLHLGERVDACPITLESQVELKARNTGAHKRILVRANKISLIRKGIGT